MTRPLWAATEPLHAIAYFDPAVVSALKAAGTRGWWMSYFVGRFGPVGAVEPGPATAMAFGFAPAMVARALPDAWRCIKPDVAVRAWTAAAGASLRHHLAEHGQSTVDELTSLATRAVAACSYDGRPLAAAWNDVRKTGDPYVDLWLAVTVLREHRGDGHVLACVAAGLSGLEATLTNVATGAVTREVMQPNRGWSDAEWDEGIQGLTDRGVLDGQGKLTDAGRRLRVEVESTTDALARAPFEELGPDADRLIELATPLSRHLIDGGVVPLMNPIGAPRP